MKKINMPPKETVIKHSTLLVAYLLVVWGFYRFLVRLPEEIEEVIIKPILWLGPVAYFVKKEKLGVGSLGITTKNLFPSLFWAIGLGAIFTLEGVVINAIKYDTINFNANVGQTAMLIAFGISLFTATSEEITFRGYFYNRMAWVLKNDFVANLFTSFIWGLIHLPISIFWLELSFWGCVGYFLLTFVFGMGAAFIFSRTRNIFSSILLHSMWSWPIILFR
ncbi:CPBP family intramembrane metalloprotease [Candidatus Woesebacteria bacterium]|nr:MAG: CPBP family intramembrane metalloprotease [Candidatus Woesebacteria bacterium]